MPTTNAMTQADGADAPSTVDIINRLELSLSGTDVNEKTDAVEIGWATRATPLLVAQRVLRLEGECARLHAENVELRAAVKSSAPTVAMKTYDASDHCAALLTGAWLLEQRGDKCRVEFARDGEQHIIGLALSVEDL